MPVTPPTPPAAHCIPTVSRWNSSIARRISRSDSRRRCSFCRRTEVLTIGMTASVRIVITVIVMTSSTSVHPPEDGREKKSGERAAGEGERKEMPTPFPSACTAVRPPSVLDIASPETLLRDLELAAGDFRVDGATVGRDEVNLVGVELESGVARRERLDLDDDRSEEHTSELQSHSFI